MKESAAPILEVRDLQAGYEDLLILDGISITVPPGSFVCLVGPNGAGKSTLLKAIYGLASVRSGRVVFRGNGRERDITGKKAHELTALGMNYVPQLDNVFPTLSVLENLKIGGRGQRQSMRERLHSVFESFPLLAQIRERPAGSLSGGQRQMLALARALMSDPQLLFLDEPSAGLAPQAVDDLFERLQHIHHQGVGILMVEQNARRALAMSDYGYVLEGGKNRYEGTGATLLGDERVLHLYLGRRAMEREPTELRMPMENAN